MPPTVDQSTTAAGRITVGLLPKVAEQLDQLREVTNLSKTDVVNRAISLYRLVEEQRHQGRKLAFYDETKESFQIVEIL